MGFHTNKTSSNENSQVIIHKSAANTHNLYAIELNNIIDHIGIILLSIQYMITPIIDTTNTLQSSIGYVNILHGNCTSNRGWNVFLSVNTMTE